MNNRIRIARTNYKYELNSADSGEIVLADGQPFYEKGNDRLFIGDGQTKIKDLRFSLNAGVDEKSNVSLGISAYGRNSIYSNSGEKNIAVGDYSLCANADGNENVSIGFQAGDALLSGSENTIVGSYAMGSVGKSDGNVAVGARAFSGRDTGTTS